MYKNIIFDLDLTLVDTTILEPGRKSRQWNQVYEMIPQATLYPGMDKVLEVIRKHGIRVAIVSTSPDSMSKK